ncbi:haloacid dehalogenase [Marinilactibacillus sp. 15R]|uniref:Cof-type HAD-IIB family hydrolase n=1 Tax=Marinilactibacillus sp. 15R TaxID=1911586 RepID=UPI000909F7AC|nr:Cof-type HAD-IIB family hydrolase [Marinilactibacillus sp. 15R]API90172.1 haloacid dehalogenase [Marinilactibacillus sp. 15R]
MKPKALVFFDLDGTLLNNQSELDQDVIEALEKLKVNGGVPFISTGRSHLQVEHVLKETAIDSFISLNGHYIQYEGEDVYEGIFEQSLLDRIQSKVDKTGISVAYYSKNGFRVTRKDKNSTKAYEFIHTEVPEVDQEYKDHHEILMALLFTEHTELDLEFLEEFPELSFYRNSPFSIDTILKENSKAIGINRLVKKLGFEDVPTYAFGDGPNDLEMLKEVDYSVAMGNGTTEVKAVADYIAKSNINGGIVDGLKHFGLI